MANKNRRNEPYHRVYNRKILRSIIKHTLKTNKIRNTWHQLRAEGRV